MGQDSSQIEGETHDNDGVVIKMDPEEKENGNIHNVSNWDGSAVEKGSTKKSTMKAPKARKKRPKRRRSSSSPKATFETAKDRLGSHSVGEGRGYPDLAQRDQQGDESNGIGGIGGTPSVPSHLKAVETEAKKRRLLAMISAAAGNIDRHYSEPDTNNDAAEESNHATQESGDERDQYFQAQKFAKAPQRPKRAGLITKRSNIGKVNGRLTPEATQVHEGSPTKKTTKKKKSQSHLNSTSDEVDGKNAKQMSELQLATPSKSSQASHLQPLEDPFTTQNSSVKDNRTAKNKQKSKTGGRASSTNISTKKHHSQENVSGNNTSYEEETSDDSSSYKASPVSKKRAPRGSTLPIDRQTDMSSHDNQSLEEGMDVIDPALRDVGYDGIERPKKIGVYRDSATPQTTGKRKRRLPIDEDGLDQIPGSEPKTKKSRKSLLKPKTPNKQGRKTTASGFRQGSPDLDMPSPKNRRRNSTKKKEGALEPIIKGKFTPKELEIMQLEKNKYEEMTGITTFSLNEIIQDTPGKVSALWDEICAALPNRPRQAIVKVGRRKFHNFGVRGKWTKEEDEELKGAYERFPKCWKQIGQILNRHHEDVRDRWRNYLVCGDNMKRESWTEEEEDNLRAVVGECIQAVRELKAAEIAQNPNMPHDPRPDIELVDWQIVSEKFGRTRSRLQCLDKWNRLTRLEDSEGDAKELSLVPRSWRVKNANKDVKHMRREDYLELLLALRNTHAGREGKVNWTKLGDMDLRIKWTCMTRKVAWKKLRASVPGNEEMKFQDIVTFLLNNLPENDAELEGIDGVIYARTGDPVEEEFPSPQKRSLSEAISSAGEDEDANIDPNLDELDSGDFDPDEILKRRGLVPDNGQNSDLNKGILREVIGEEYFESGDSGDEDEDGGIAMAMAEEGSIDLDQSNAQDEARSGASRLRSPIAFKAVPNHDESEYVDSPTDSDEEDVDMDIPARRPSEHSRLESVDLDMN